MSRVKLGMAIADYYIGLDLGQAQDYSALAIVEKVWGLQDLDDIGRFGDIPLPDKRIAYNVLHLERFPLGTSYPTIVELVANRVRSLPTGGKGRYRGSLAQKVLAVDATGVGRPVVDLLRDAAVGDLLVAIQIHGGNTVTFDKGYYGVPKRDLIGAIQVLQQRGSLKVARGLPEWETLKRELHDYRYKLTFSAHDTYNAREGAHDDLVLALGVAVWTAREGITGGVPWDEETVEMLSRSLSGRS